MSSTRSETHPSRLGMPQEAFPSFKPQNLSATPDEKVQITNMLVQKNRIVRIQFYILGDPVARSARMAILRHASRLVYC